MFKLEEYFLQCFCILLEMQNFGQNKNVICICLCFVKKDLVVSMQCILVSILNSLSSGNSAAWFVAYSMCNYFNSALYLAICNSKDLHGIHTNI